MVQRTRWPRTQHMRNLKRNNMKILTTLLAAALVAGVSTVAMAQSSGGSGSDVNPNQMGRGADANPSGLNADPMAGNHGNTTQAAPGQTMGRDGNMDGMTSSNVSGQWTDQNMTTRRGDRRDR